MERVTNNLDNCNFRNKLIDTFIVHHLLPKLNSDSVKIMSCLSPIDGVGLPYYEKYLKPEKKSLICIPLCDGVHFQGYIVNIKEQKIVHIDSLRWDQTKIQPLFKLQKYCLKIQSQVLNSFFRKENSLTLTTSVWLLAGMSSYLINLPEFSDRYNAFDIAYNLLERNPIIQKVESLSPQFSTEDQMKKIASADFWIHVLTNDPESSEYFRQFPPIVLKTSVANFIIKKDCPETLTKKFTSPRIRS